MQIKKFDGVFEFLSNKSISTFYYKGVKYKSVVHAYQSLKAKKTEDAIKIRLLKTTDDVMKESRDIEIKPNWQDSAGDVMYELIYTKFSTNMFLKPKLLATDGFVLGDGRNFVGQILMEVRDRLKHEQKNETT